MVEEGDIIHQIKGCTFSVRRRIDTESWSVSVVISFLFLYSGGTHFISLLSTSLFWFLPCQSEFVLLLWQRVKELLSCLKWRVSTGGRMMIGLLLPLTIPSSRLQRLVLFLGSLKNDRKQDTLWQSLISQGPRQFVSSTHTSTPLRLADCIHLCCFFSV